MDGGAVAIILARGGSKGVPRKNIREIGGRPCIAWTINDALEAQRVTECIVSSDDAEILAIAERTPGVTPLERPADLAGDRATVDAAARHAAASLPAEPSVIVILYGNVPVRPLGLIDRAVQLLLDTSCDSVQSYAPVGKHHPWWTAVIETDGSVRAFDGGALNHNTYRRQDLPPAHIPDGGVIALTADALFERIEHAPEGPHRFLGVDRRGVLTDEGEVVDIDAEHDLLIAETALLRRGMGVRQ